MTWQWLAVRRSVQKELRSVVASDATYRWNCGLWLRAGSGSNEAQGIGEVPACQRQIWWFRDPALAPELQSTITSAGRQFPSHWSVVDTAAGADFQAHGSLRAGPGESP